MTPAHIAYHSAFHIWIVAEPCMDAKWADDQVYQSFSTGTLGDALKQDAEDAVPKIAVLHTHVTLCFRRGFKAFTRKGWPG
jgi:hypothetical protein